MESICVFCGSSMGREKVYQQKAFALGKLLAINNITLVYGGADIGLMKVLADTVLTFGGSVEGVMPGMLVEKEIAHQNLTKLHIVDSMHERKLLMAKLSDAFIAMPGGFGILDELAEVFTWAQLEIINKPCAIFNVNGYFDHLISFLDHSVNERFLRHEHRNNIIIDSDENRLLEKIISFKPIPVDSKWVDELKLI
ncbi:MAG: TIGR00730 family Rossman fold protein [Bacteroidales bacterium]|nr:TIGR00730 family Rossman fold protein [Bacteroidales bacterium]